LEIKVKEPSNWKSIRDEEKEAFRPPFFCILFGCCTAL
jgi:hypothetical protein